MTTYVLVHGGFTDSWYWGETAALLEKAGHEVRLVGLPSTGNDPATLGGLAEDAAEVRRVVAAAGGSVVLVGHSSGGMVITELADDPRVAHSVYVGAFLPTPGETPLGLLGGDPPPWMVLREDETIQITDDLELARAELCAELPDDRLPEWSRHRLLSLASTATTPSTAPDRRHPATYVVLERDRTIPPAAQERMAARADRIERLATSHQAMLADPEGLAAILLGVS